MELTEEQYTKAARYVDGEMDAGERQAFEATLIQNSALMEEAGAYQQKAIALIRQLKKGVN